MKVNEDKVLNQMKDVLAEIRNAYSCSNSCNCDAKLCRAIGKLDALIEVLEATKEG